jgi:hypothetical protein
MFDSYSFIACDAAQTNAERLVQKHRLKGEKRASLFRSPHRPRPAPPALPQPASQPRLLPNRGTRVQPHHRSATARSGDEQQAWRLRTMMTKLIFLPGRLARCARQMILKIQVPGQWLAWWQRW